MRKSEKRRLHDTIDVGNLFCGEIPAPDAVMHAAVLTGMFFRPEEDTLLSERLHDAHLLQSVDIHIRHENDRGVRMAAHGAVHIAVDFNLHGLLTMSALRLYDNAERFPAQAPLHEGRGKCIHRSGGINLLTGIEGDPVGRLLPGYRIGP